MHDNRRVTGFRGYVALVFLFRIEVRNKRVSKQVSFPGLKTGFLFDDVSESLESTVRAPLTFSPKTRQNRARAIPVRLQERFESGYYLDYPSRASLRCSGAYDDFGFFYVRPV